MTTEVRTRPVGDWTPEDLREYDARRRALRDRVQAIGVGTQMRISYDVRLPASMISNVLTGRYTDPKVLDSIEGWLDKQAVPADDKTAA